VTSSPGGLTASTTGALTATVTGLTNGTAYTFSVTATNLLGTGPASAASNSVTPTGPPGAPTNVTATPGNGQATVTWAAPASNGGSPITSYTVTSSPGALTATSSGALTAIVTGLTNGIAYTFTVTATNLLGTGPPSAASTPVTPATLPGAPTNVTATAGHGAATVTWTAPADGGSPITGYTVTSTPDGKTATTNGTTTTATVSGLTNGTAYTFTVTATNAIGTGPPSAASKSVTPTGPPGAPTNVTATPGNGQATVSWTAPASNGGSPITSYTVTSSPGGLTASTTGALTATVTGLTNGTAYTFTVTATNALGTGPASVPSNSVTPATVPGAPTNVTAAAGILSATVTWTAPADNGGSAITSYTVTSSPAGGTATVPGGTTMATLTGLLAGTAYSFKVSAMNAAGTGPESAPSSSVTPLPPPPPPPPPPPLPATGGQQQYHALPPARILDTRTGTGGVPVASLGPASTLDVQIAGRGGVPASGVSAVVLNATVTNTTTPGYLVVYGRGVARPLASNLNWTAGQTVPNLVEVPVGPDGKVTVFNSQGSTDVIFDVAGYVSTADQAAGSAGLFNPLVPARLLDTRTGMGGATTLGAGGTVSLQLSGRGNVPANGVSAVVLNVTATNPSTSGYITVWPDGAPRPLASSLNFVAGQTVPNRVIVAVGSGGKVDLYNFAGNVDLVVDVGGYFTDATPGGTGSRFNALTPARLLDTRDGSGGVSSAVGAGGILAVQVAGQKGVPAMTAAIPPTAVVLNVTVTNPTTAGYLTVWPDGSGQPLASDLNFGKGQTRANLVVVKVGANGKVDLFSLAGSTDVVIDVVGWYG
jgi:hypothetical protein